jgi:hypothetical protein
VQGELYSKLKANPVCCMLCLRTGNVDPVFAFGQSDVSNLTRHLKRVHTEQWDENEKKRKEAGQPQGDNPLGFAPVPRPPVEDRTLRKVMVAFSNAQCVRMLVAALVLANRAVHMLSDPFFRLALLMISGGTFKTPDEETVTKIEKEFEKECRENIYRKLIKDGVLGADGKVKASSFPLISIGFDASSTQIDGAQAARSAAYAACRPARCSARHGARMRRIYAAHLGSDRANARRVQNDIAEHQLAGSSHVYSAACLFGCGTLQIFGSQCRRAGYSGHCHGPGHVGSKEAEGIPSGAVGTTKHCHHQVCACRVHRQCKRRGEGCGWRVAAPTRAVRVPHAGPDCWLRSAAQYHHESAQ